MKKTIISITVDGKRGVGSQFEDLMKETFGESFENISTEWLTDEEPDGLDKVISNLDKMVEDNKKKDHGINGVARQKDVQKLEKRVAELELIIGAEEDMVALYGKAYHTRFGRIIIDGEELRKKGE